jgi:hypothetical protein
MMTAWIVSRLLCSSDEHFVFLLAIRPPSYFKIKFQKLELAYYIPGGKRLSRADLRYCQNSTMQVLRRLHCAAALIKKILVKGLDDLCARNPAVLVRYRNQKIRKVGHWNEG